MTDENNLLLSGLYDSIRAMVRFGDVDLDALLETVKQFYEHANALYGK